MKLTNLLVVLVFFFSQVAPAAELIVPKSQNFQWYDKDGNSIFWANIKRNEKEIKRIDSVLEAYCSPYNPFFFNAFEVTELELGEHQDFDCSWSSNTTGDDRMYITNISIDGPDWQITSNSCGLGQTSCSFSLRFDPNDPGIKNAWLGSTTKICNSENVCVDGSGGGIVTGLALNHNECKTNRLGSIIAMDDGSMRENVSIVGTDLDLYYSTQFTSSYTRNNVPLRINNYNPEGWSVSKVHFFNPKGNRLYLGNGTIAVRKPFTNQDGEFTIVNDEEIYTFDSFGKHLTTKSTLTGYVKYSFSYSTDSKLIKITDSYGNETLFNRDSSGALSSIRSPQGQITTVSIHSNGLINQITDPKGQSFSVNFYPDSDLVQEFTKSSGIVSFYEYDNRGRIILTESNGGNFSDYFSSGNGTGKYMEEVSGLGRTTTIETSTNQTGAYTKLLTEASGFTNTTIENPDRSTSYSNFFESGSHSTTNDERFGDSKKRFSQSTETRNGQTKTTIVTQNVTLSDPSDPFSYSNIEKITSVNNVDTVETFYKSTMSKIILNPMGVQQSIQYDAYEKPISIQAGTDVPLTFTYDSLGRVIQTTQNGHNTLNYAYNSKGQLATKTNAFNQVTRNYYDLAGNKTKVVYPDGRFVTMAYNGDGKITRITPPGRPAHIFRFNLLGLPSVYNPPLIPETESPETRYSYNIDKQLTVIRRPDGKTVRYNYDETTGLLKRMVLGENEFQRYSYLANTDKVRGIVSPDSVRSVFSYFGRDTIESESHSFANTTTNTIFSFDDFFRVNRRILRVNQSEIGRINYIYRNDNQPSRVGDLIHSYHESTGRLNVTRLDKIRDARTYDNYGNLKTYKATYHPEEGNSQELYYYNLTRDSLNRIVTKVERVQGITTTYEYSYDVVGRLSSVTKNGIVDSSFNYDDNGNRSSGTQNGIPFTATFDDQDRLLTYSESNDPLISYSYNNNGELIQKASNSETTSFVSDSLGRLKSVTLPNSKVIDYKLDWSGRRTIRNVDGVQTARNIFESTYKLAAEIDASNTVKEFVTSTSVNSADYIKIGTNKYKIIKDHLGSPRLVVNAADGSIAQKMSYNEWGRVIEDTNPGFQPFGFAGGLYDPETKLVKFGARDYDGRVGRWLSKDPIRFEGGDTNLYGYVLNDPVNFIDPTGKNSEDVLDKGTCWALKFVDPSAKCGDWDENLGDILCKAWPSAPACNDDDKPNQCFSK